MFEFVHSPASLDILNPPTGFLASNAPLMAASMRPGPAPVHVVQSNSFAICGTHNISSEDPKCNWDHAGIPFYLGILM